MVRSTQRVFRYSGSIWDSFRLSLLCLKCNHLFQNISQAVCMSPSVYFKQRLTCAYGVRPCAKRCTCAVISYISNTFACRSQGTSADCCCWLLLGVFGNNLRSRDTSLPQLSTFSWFLWMFVDGVWFFWLPSFLTHLLPCLFSLSLSSQIPPLLISSPLIRTGRAAEGKGGL